MYEALTERFDQTRAERLTALYTSARRKLVDEVYPRVIVANPGLTDHSGTHIANVLDNADHLVAPDAFEKRSAPFSAADVYVLCLAILFHDAGMVYGRDGHERQIAKIYNLVRGSSDPPLQEKALVYHIALAHTGTINGGSKDTIARVPVSMDLDGEKVQSRELAALVRFADELAEGPQRTSSLKGDPPFDREADSEVYHRYASISNIHIDREDGRIALTYHFDMCDDYMDPNAPRFRDLLEFTFKRALKIDRERRYARFYSIHLAPFTRTTVALNFWDNAGLALPLGPLELSAKSALTQGAMPLGEYDASFDVDRIVQHLQQKAT